MTPTPTTHEITTLRRALSAADPSIRLRAAMTAGTSAPPELLDVLVDRCAVEPDFFVRDMLTWALTRLPAHSVIARLRSELTSPSRQARSQALHTLSKIGAPGTWEWVTVVLLTHDDDEVARSAWRAAVALTPVHAHPDLARVLAGQLGRGDRDLQLSLSRAMVALDADHAAEAITSVMEAAGTQPDPDVAAHAHATMSLMQDPELGFDAALHEARRVHALGGHEPSGHAQGGHEPNGQAG